MSTLRVLSLTSVLVASGCGGKALRAAEHAVLADPGAVAVWVMLGDTYRDAHRKKDALGAYHRALSLDPASEEIQARIAEIGGDRASAAAKLERKALRNPLDDELWGDLGDEYGALGQRDQALRAYLYAFQLDPGDSEWQRKVVEYGGLDEIVRIVEESAEGLQDDERLGDFGDLMAEAGRTEDACALWSRAAALDPSDSEWVDRMTRCAGGYVDPGAVPVDHASTPTGDTGLTALGRSALVSGDRARALEYFQAALLEDHADKEALIGVMVLTGQPLVGVLETLATHSANNDELWGDLGDAYVAVGNLAAARTAYGRAAELDPADGEWRRKRTLLDPGPSSPTSTPPPEPLFRLSE